MHPIHCFSLFSPQKQNKNKNKNIMMMNFCKNSVHSFLGFSPTFPINIDCNEKPKSFNSGLYLKGLVTATGEVSRPPNVVESSCVVKSPPSPAPPEKKDPGGIGFMDEMGGDVNGLMSCTESLGFESSDERLDDSMEEVSYSKTTSCSPSKLKLKRLEGKREGKNFPPPLSSLYHDGQPSFFLRPVRKDGRLELTEVRIDRPSVFHAYREDGRLRLHIVKEEEDGEEEEDDDVDVDVDETEEEVETEEENRGGKDEEKVNDEWVFEEFKRCNQNSNHHNHHHDLHVWSQHCATRG